MSTVGEQKDTMSWKRVPKYIKIKEALEKEISRLDPGDRLPSVRELKKEFKVTQNTLVRALNELESDNLIVRRRGSGIYVNRKEAREKNHMIGVVVSDIGGRFRALLVKGIERKLSEDNYKMILCNGYKEFRDELDVIHSLKGKIDGLILNPTTRNIHNPEYVKYFVNLARSKECPFILVDILIPGIRADFIGFNNFKGFYEVARTILREKNNHRILYLGSLDSFIGMQRLHGFKEGLKEAQVDEEKVEIIHVDLLSLKMDIPWEKLASPGPRPVFFFVASPLMLPKLTHIIQGRGIKIPEEALIISVVEEDYKDYIGLPVIALVKPSIKLGAETAAIVRDMIEERPVKETTGFDLQIEVPEILKHLI